MSSQGLLFIFAEPGSRVTDEEYLEWIDVHVPPYVAVKGIINSLVYKVVDSQQRTFFGAYDLSSPEVLATDAFTSVPTKASQRDMEVLLRLDRIERRDCQHISTHQSPGVQLPGKYVTVESLEIRADGEGEFKEWYNGEHMDRMSKIPGFLRGRAYRCLNRIYPIGKADSTGTADATNAILYVGIHEFDRLPTDDTPENRALLDTPLGQEVMRKYLVSRERRVFELSKVFESPKPE